MTERALDWALAGGLVGGVIADALLGDPRRGHPVALFGRAAQAVQDRLYADRRLAGVGYTASCVTLALGPALLADYLTRREPLARLAATAATAWAVTGAASLAAEAERIAGALERGDLTAARAALPALCGRDPAGLGATALARAVIESVAENTSDAVVAPLLWGAVAGPAGLLGYRAVNTLDAMVGHRSPRYERFGWAAARLDDLLNLAGARLTATLAAMLAPTVGGSIGDAVGVWRRDAGGHPSPNAGPVEASFAGALGIRLGGVNVYGERVEDRHVLGDGRPAACGDVSAARELARRVGLAALAVAMLIASAPRPRPRPRRGR
jgi:adenosylcobinamide-phosphate synthase